MDLKGMLNDGAAPEKKSSPGSPLPTPAGRSSGPQTAPIAALHNGAPPSAGAYAPTPTASQQSTPTPLYPPAPLTAGPPGNPQSRGLTPLQTPGHAAANGQYPFPQQAAQSPAAAPGQPPYRSYEPYSASTPGARPASYGYPMANPSPSPYNQSLHQQHPSQSPTPSSMRQSPLAHIAQAPHQQAPPPQYQHSQPNTPLGPPPHIPRHGTNQFDASSPFHQRTFSATSNGAMPSPAQHQASIGSLVQSPSAHHRPSPQTRNGSDYHSLTDRERSLSVSPKTMVPPRPPSLGSRSSSQNDVYSARSSTQPTANVAPYSETPNHVKPPTPSYAQPQSSYLGGHVAQAHPQASRQIPGNPAIDSLSAGNNNQMPLQHSPQRMGMNHLLAPTDHGAPRPNSGNGSPAYQNMSSHEHSDRSQPGSHALSAAPPQVTHSHAPSTESESAVKSQRATPATTSQNPGAEAQYSLNSQRETNGTALSSMEQRSSLKRSAESEIANERPLKKERRGRYLERPVWANLNPRNPRARQPGVVPNGTASRSAKAPAPAPAQAVSNGPPPLAQTQIMHTNGHRPAIDVTPWRQNPPLDNNLIHSRSLLGPWERSMVWKTNVPSVVRAVTDWIYLSLNNLRDVGFDPRESCIEIEGKIGTLLTQTGERCTLPVKTMTVITPNSDYEKSLRFESQMQDKEHKNMNEFLNTAVQDSHRESGREKIIYKHLHETDSFRALSEAGIRALPDAILRHNHRNRDLKLRTTMDSKTRQLTAHIVKVKVGDLHIFSPQDPYDMRISVNIECNLMRPDIDVQAIIKEPSINEPVQPDRKKDRLSYKQLKYSIDLTRVDQSGMAPKYELEIEVDANSLRHEMNKMIHGQESGFTDIVDGFMENAQWLMKQPRQ